MYGVLLMEEHHNTLADTNPSSLSLKRFLEQDELIFCLCVEYFERSIFSAVHDLVILKGLVSLIRHRYWIDDYFVLGRIICTMSRRSLDAGLNRWEYYIGQEEEIAEENRKLWWDCYWWDRWYTLNSGKEPMISDEMTSCLFPKKVIGLGVDDSMDCLTLIDSVKLDPTKLDICVSFGYILLAKLITTVFFELLYNRKFTDYRLFAVPDAKDLNRTARQLKVEFFKIRRIFLGVQDKLIPFLKQHFENSRIFELYTHFEFSKVCCFQGMESLILRIQNLLQSSEKVGLDICIKQTRLQTFETSVDILTEILRLKDSLHIMKCSWFLYAILLRITSYFIENSREDPIYHLSLMCGVIALYNDLLINSNNIDVNDNNAFYKKLKNGTTMSFILTRICCQVYMRSQKISEELLFHELKKYGQACLNAVKAVLDIACVWYENIIGDHKESNFRKEILNILDRDMGDFVNNNIGVQGKKDGTLHHEGFPVNSSGVSLGLDFISLENFVTSDSLPDFLNLFWDEIELGISK